MIMVVESALQMGKLGNKLIENGEKILQKLARNATGVVKKPTKTLLQVFCHVLECVNASDKK